MNRKNSVFEEELSNNKPNSENKNSLSETFKLGTSNYIKKGKKSLFKYLKITITY